MALTAMTRIPKLANCDQASFFQCLLTLSALGLEPDGRRAHLIPFENRKRQVTECQLIVDWKGLVELVMRSGSVANLHADVIREGDDLDYSAGKLKTHIPWFLRRDAKKPEKPGEVFAAYAMAEFKDGTTKSEVLSLDEIHAVRDGSQGYRSAIKYNNDTHPWIAHFPEMAKKTAFRRLSKWLPLSPEYRDALEKEETMEVAPPAISIVSSVQNPFQVVEQEPELLPPSDTSNPELNPATKTEGQSIKTQLAELVTGAKHTFDDFRKWGVTTGQFTEAEADAIGSFEEVPQAKAAMFVKNKTGMLKGIAMAKGAQ